MMRRPVRKTQRLRDFDYASAGSYFVTISTKFQQHFFGEIFNGTVQLNPLGVLVGKIWHEIPVRYANTVLDAFIIMPNHLHGIIELRNFSRTDAINRVRTKGRVRSEDQKISGGITGAKNPMLTKGSLSNTIRWFKGRTAYEIRKSLDPAFAWHSRFYERIIRNERALNRIRAYIEANPLRWGRDPHNAVRTKLADVRTRLIASVQGKIVSLQGEIASAENMEFNK